MGDAHRDEAALLSRLPALLRVIRRFGAAHRRWLIAGSVAAAAVIGSRLALPWLVKSIVTSWLDPTNDAGPTSTGVLVAGGLGLGICVILGVSDHLERLWFARYAIGLVRDLRASAFEAACRRRPGPGRRARADLLARLVGDAARVKTGLKGFLVHVATGCLLLVGVIAVLVWTAPELGAVFAVAVVLLLGTTALGATRLFRRSTHHRRKEGKLAGLMARALQGDRQGETLERINRKSGRAEASVTKAQGLTTLVAYVVFGAAVLVGLLWGLRLVEAGRLSAEAMVVVVLYAFMMRRPMVQLARQGARTGKIFASVARLDEVLATGVGERTTSADRRAEVAASSAPEVAPASSGPGGGGA